MRWFRFYDDALNDPKVQNLAPALFKAWVNLLCLASKNDGRLPEIRDIAFALRIAPGKTADIVKDLETAGLIDRDETGLLPHNWSGRQRSGDDSAERAKRYRYRKRHATSNGVERDASRDGDALEQSREEKNREEQSRADVTRDAPRTLSAPAPSEAIRIRQAVVALFGESEVTLGWHWSEISTLLDAGYTEAEIMREADRAKARGVTPKKLGKYLRPGMDDLRTQSKAAPPKPKTNFAKIAGTG